MSEAASPEWWFYHLERTTVERAAPALIVRCLQAGWRVLAVSENVERCAALDEALWTFDDQSFVPHGQAEAPGLDAARQPVLLSGKAENVNQADALFLMDGADVDVNSVYKRCMVMFDGQDQSSRQVARKQFKAAQGAGLVTRYFQQTSSGGWKEAG